MDMNRSILVQVVNDHVVCTPRALAASGAQSFTIELSIETSGYTFADHNDIVFNPHPPVPGFEPPVINPDKKRCTIHYTAQTPPAPDQTLQGFVVRVSQGTGVSTKTWMSDDPSIVITNP